MGKFNGRKIGIGSVIGGLALAVSLVFVASVVLADDGSPFDPGDGRVNARTGDRLAVWCRPDSLDVWGIDGQAVGQRLAMFTPEELSTASSKAVSKNLNGHGTLTVSVNKDGSYEIALKGGEVGATGVGPFAKTAPCPVIANGAAGAPFEATDGRLEPRVGDRLALYTKLLSIDVWGIGPDNEGIWLTTFSQKDMETAQDSKLTRKLSDIKGTLTLIGHGNGQYSVVWEGGKFDATGKAGFTKMFAYVLPQQESQ
jgi:hypothetical protein